MQASEYSNHAQAKTGDKNFPGISCQEYQRIQSGGLITMIKRLLGLSDKEKKTEKSPKSKNSGNTNKEQTGELEIRIR